jgi:hypothetical protein
MARSTVQAAPAPQPSVGFVRCRSTSVSGVHTRSVGPVRLATVTSGLVALTPGPVPSGTSPTWLHAPAASAAPARIVTGRDGAGKLSVCGWFGSLARSSSSRKEVTTAWVSAVAGPPGRTAAVNVAPLLRLARGQLTTTGSAGFAAGAVQTAGSAGCSVQPGGRVTMIGVLVSVALLWLVHDAV